MTAPVTRPVALLAALFFARGVVLCCVLPPGEMWDEYSHLAHVDQWAATGRPAVYGRTAVDPAFLATMARLPQPPAAGFGRAYGRFWAGSPAPPLPASLGLYEAQHPFLYYALAAPVYRACGGRDDLPAAVAGLRLVNLGCGTAAVVLVLRWLTRTLPASAVWAVGSWVALQPLLLLNVTRVANDGLAFLLGTAVVVAALDLGRPRFWPRVSALSVLLPVAVLAKATNAALVPAVVVAIGLAGPARGGRVRLPSVAAEAGPGAAGWGRSAVAILLVLGVTATLLAPYVAFNLRTFGVVTPMQEAVANRAAGRPAWAVAAAAPPWRWPAWAASWWVANGLWVGGWSFLTPPRGLVVAYATLVAVAAGATVLRWRSLPVARPARRVMVAVVGCVHALLTVHAAESAAAWGGRVFTNSWYAAVAVPWALVLLGCGGLSLGRGRRWVLLGVPAVFVTTETLGVVGRMVPAYYAAGVSTLAVRRMASVHPSALGPATLAAAATAVVVLLVVCARRAMAVEGGPPGTV